MAEPIPIYVENSLLLQLNAVLRSPFIVTILFIAYAFLLWRIFSGRWKRSSIIFKAIFLLLPLLAIFLFPAIASGESPFSEYGLWVDLDNKKLIFKTLGGGFEASLCEAEVRIVNTSKFMDNVGLRLLGHSDPSTDYHIGVYTFKGAERAYLLIKGVDRVVYIRYNNTVGALGVDNIEDVYNKIIEIMQRECQSR